MPLRERQVRVDGSEVQFLFRGENGVHHAAKLHDRRLARIIGQTRDLPAQELPQYIDDDGQPHAVGSQEVNDQLQAIGDADYPAKDFRTGYDTVLAPLALRPYPQFDRLAQTKRNVAQAIASVARKLGNTPTVCRKCYVHPAVIASYLDGTMLEALRARAHAQLQHELPVREPAEAAVLALLQYRLRSESE